MKLVPWPLKTLSLGLLDVVSNGLLVISSPLPDKASVSYESTIEVAENHQKKTARLKLDGT